MATDNRLSQWITTYTSELYSWAYHKLSDTELAKDLVQDTFLAATEKINDFKGESSPKTWLFSILNHKIIDIYRKKVNQTLSIEEHFLNDFFDADGTWKSERRPKDWHEDEGHLLDDNEFQEVLKKCLKALPEKWSICVRLKYLMGKNGEEICHELDLAPTNMWQIIHMAKLQLRDCVDKYWFKN